LFPFKNRKAEHVQENKLYYSYSSESSTKEDSDEMSFLLTTLCKSYDKEIIFLCIGSDRSTGDSFGPFVGTMLKENKFPHHVYGTIAEPVHALNLEVVLKEIRNRFTEPTIFGVDACLGDIHQIGSILLKEGPLIPGCAINNFLPEVGNYHLKAVVNFLDSNSPVSSLNTTRLDTVLDLAKITSTIILNSAKNKSNVKRTTSHY
jgi:putative sporulation protein YyaC